MVLYCFRVITLLKIRQIFQALRMCKFYVGIANKLKFDCDISMIYWFRACALLYYLLIYLRDQQTTGARGCHIFQRYSANSLSFTIPR